MIKTKTRWLGTLAMVGLATGVVVACGSEGDPLIPAPSDEAGVNPNGPGPVGADGSAADASGAMDGNADAADAADAHEGGGTGLGGGSGAPCVDGSTCAATEQCIAGKCGCPLYSVSCNGVCTVTSNDPANCGGCGVTCAAPKVCSGGSCNATCFPGLEPCSGKCVDKKSDNDNCGACGTKCGAGMGCVDGACVPSTVFTSPIKCIGGGPPITIADGAKNPCAGSLAQVTFTWGICSCKDAMTQSNFYFDGFNSLKGGYDPGKPKLGGGIGANGKIRMTSDTDVWGQVWASQTSSGQAWPHAFSTASTAAVHHDVQCGGALDGANLTSGRDAHVSGDISGTVKIAKTLYQTPGATRSAGTTFTTLDTSANVTVKPPCDCQTKVPVAAIVAARQASNDNALIALDPDIFNKPMPPKRIDLPCGHYYLKGFNLTSASSIVAHGRTAIYIDGDISASAFLAITLDPTGELDVFVSGTVTATSTLRLGSANYPALMRVYVGGSQPFVVSSTIIVATNLWAGNSSVTWESNSDMFGALFAGDLLVKSNFNMHHDTAVVTAGATCSPPGGAPDAGAPDAGGGDASASADGGGATPCGSCKDCGNQACVQPAGVCGTCTTSAQCCSPLVCVGGTCRISP